MEKNLEVVFGKLKLNAFNGIGIKVVVEPTLNSDQIVALRLIDEEEN